MKRIIALSSFLFLLLMTVLPAGISHAATNAAVKLNGITLVLADGKTINAVGAGNNNFLLNLVGGHDVGDKIVKEIQITSDTATTLSLLPADFDYSQVAPLTKDEFDIQFVDGVAVLDPQKAANWSDRIAKLMGDTDPVEENLDYLFTVDELRTDIFPTLSGLYSNFLDVNVESNNKYVFPGYLTDKDGNKSTASLTVLTKGWKKEAKGWKYYDEYGDYLTGWYKENGKWYYLNPKAEGVMVTGWFKVNGKWYFFNPAGDMKTGWFKDKGKWYYLDPVNGDASIGWDKIGGKWYYFDSVNGDMKIGWIKLANKWYYLDPVNGDMKTGWIKLANKWYYLDLSSGVMKTGKVKIGSKTYTFASDGHWLY
ncbi:N-acetylmuramoyl-L-alanine amidase family protein [Neobacillus bataviensis]|uniref:N-acetylmuramoyl-L-alanine amidase family protein n=1 Tax=Neobacillus bataviensis TaxID=220685 RepID=UPI001CBD315D|nr:N-acetylmuramoyl-L-alanine amidase family protein [Neobacillus bataviensis]